MIVSKHFTVKELACQCGCGFLPTKEFQEKLDLIQDAFIKEEKGHTLSFNSVARCSTHNRSLKPPGARFSAHVQGIAADVRRTPELMRFILNNADRFNIWIESPDHTPTWIHFDMRPRTSGRVFLP